MSINILGINHKSAPLDIREKLVFDKDAIRIKPSASEIFTVISKEYRINHYVFTVISDGLKLRSEMSLDTHLSIGEKCNVETIHDKNFLVIPENIKSNF